ncbi:hypothetical protein RKE29_21265 [Streptomyces sp. B1866]|uniref:DUF6801 domain-containing protein n=1 Tax=Streptomyces sp. B1866 TaxID=3075431 RepID=UPI00288D47C7|nr:DUF6801 domain-containing protein [Streptomyces sp. B1866]MDT3399144.1 hypothetical protein [Streptomyces sp. B1866]
MGVKARPAKARAALAAASVAVAGGLVAVVGTGDASADPVSVTLKYTCPFPQVDDQPLTVKIDSDIPKSVAVGQPTGAFKIDTVSTVSSKSAEGLSLMHGKTLEGVAKATAVAHAPQGDIAVKPNIPLVKTDIPETGEFQVKANGSTPSLRFSKPGRATVTVEDIVLSLTPRDANGELTGLDTFESECKLDPGQNNTLATIDITDPSASGSPSASSSPPVSSPPVSSPPASSPPVSSPPVSSPPVSSPPASSPPVSSPPVSSPPVSSPPASSPPPGGGIRYVFDLTGKSHIATPNGDVALKGGIDALFDPKTGTFNSDLTLNPTSGNFSILGFLPATAKVDFEQQGKTTGTLKGGKLETHSTMYVKLPEIAVFGLPVAGGDQCKTVKPSEITLKSTQDFFNPLKGGPIAGTYDLAAIQNCGGLNDFVSLFVAGSGNTINANLALKSHS